MIKPQITILAVILSFSLVTGCTNSSVTADDIRRQHEQEILEEAAREESLAIESAARAAREQYLSQSGGSFKYEVSELPESPSDQKETLQVSFVDVGQGDCIYLKTTNHDMLIDSGSYEHAGNVLRFLKNQGAGNSLDMVVATHPDADHIGGLPDILDHYRAGFLLSPGVNKDTPTYFYLQESIIRNNIMEIHPAAGQSYALGNALVTIIAPVSGTYDEINNASIVCKVTFGNTSFLFMGDAETEEENDILSSKSDINSDVIKLGHHGSSSSSSVPFLKAVSPKDAVISCGRGNDYGHPHEEVMHTLKVMRIKTYRTDEQGTVTAISDGQNITWSTDPSETYLSGN